MENKYIANLNGLIVNYLRGDDVKIILFGSRARSDNQIHSDVDIGIFPYGKFDPNKITLLREKIDNLNIPYKVEIINLKEANRTLREQAFKEGIVWKE